MADFREYQGIDFSSMFLVHYGVGHENGGHSGRYAWGSGEKPMQDSPLDKGSSTKQYRYVPSKSIANRVNSAIKRITDNEGKYGLAAIHTSAATMINSAGEKALEAYGFNTDKLKDQAQHGEKEQTVEVKKASNHANRPHARTTKTVVGESAEVKVQSNLSGRIPAWMFSNSYQNYVYGGNYPKDEIESMYSPINSNNFFAHDKEKKKQMAELMAEHPEYTSMLAALAIATSKNPNAYNNAVVSSSSKKEQAEEPKKEQAEEPKKEQAEERKKNSIVTAVLNVVKKVGSVLKKLKNVVVSWFKHSDEGFYLVHKHDNSEVYKGVDYRSHYIKHREKKHYRTYYRGISKWQTLESI